MPIPQALERFAGQAVVQPVAIRVRSHNGPAKGPAPAITYNVTITLPDGTTFEWDDITPALRQWPPPLWTMAADTTAKAEGILVGTHLFWLLTETPAHGPCPPGGG